MDWVQILEGKPVNVVITSRPAAIAGVQGEFTEIGFTARKVLPLDAKERAALVEKFARRTRLDLGRPARKPLILADLSLVAGQWSTDC